MFKTVPDSFDFGAYLKQQESKAHTMRKPSDFVEETLQRMYGDNSNVFAKLPWGNLNLQFKPGEVTLWAGANGHGKSLIISQVELGFMQQGYRCGVASFEMLPEALNSRMILQAAGGLPSPQYAKDFIHWATDKLWYADVRGTASMSDVQGIVKYAALENKCHHFFIDNLMCCVSGEDDYNSQKDFVFKLCEMARAHGIHIHVVHHIRKLESEEKIPGKYDIKGTGAITDRVDNVVLVYRNKMKERVVKEEGAKAENERRMKDGKPLLDDAKAWSDAQVIVVKNRDGGEEATVRLWYHNEGNSFHERQLQGRPHGFEVPRYVPPGLVAKETGILVEEQLS